MHVPEVCSLGSVATRSIAGPFNDGINKPRREATLIASAWLAAPSLANNAPRNGSMSPGERPSIAPIWLVGAPCASRRRASRSEGVICKTGPPPNGKSTSEADSDGMNSRSSIIIASASWQNERHLYQKVDATLDRRRDVYCL